jgi:hypothetical protein
MPAAFKIIKYTGKNSAFGTQVSSIGLKRVDAAVPAVYGNPIVPGDDKSDVNTYSVYRPDETADVAYSYESIFKLILTTVPSNQLSNIRIYPAINKPNDANLPDIYIGCSQNFTRPTNSVSLIATNDLWTYTADNPFKVTVGGETGQAVDENVPVINWNATVHDLGTGNLIYMNGERQIGIDIIVGNTYTIINNATSLITIKIYDDSDVLVTDSDVVYSTVSGNQVITISATLTLLASYPNGFKYGSDTGVTVGGTITWLDLGADPVEIVDYEVDLEVLANGDSVYTLNGERRPTLNFLENRKYRFTNLAGATNPIRFLDNVTSLIANTEAEIIVEGITVTNGATASEVVLVDPKAVRIAGGAILSYQSTVNGAYGNIITNINTALIGNYNLNTLGAGTANPLAAGETDFIFLQVKVDGVSSVGQLIPDITIEYDEN